MPFETYLPSLFVFGILAHVGTNIVSKLGQSVKFVHVLAHFYCLVTIVS